MKTWIVAVLLIAISGCSTVARIFDAPSPRTQFFIEFVHWCAVTDFADSTCTQEIMDRLREPSDSTDDYQAAYMLWCMTAPRNQAAQFCTDDITGAIIRKHPLYDPDAPHNGLMEL